jgi:hypothetical protein
MPVDKPKSGETEEQYLNYCIPAEIEAGKDQAQAVAICYNTYRTETNMSVAKRIKSLLSQESKYRGINLLAEENGLEDACWEGWEAIGTKELDGRTVPNCVPIKE